MLFYLFMFYPCIGSSYIEITMRRIITAAYMTLALVMISVPSQAKKADETNELVEFLQSYEDNDGVEIYNLKGLILKMARPTIRKSPVGEAAEYIDNLVIFSMKDAKGDRKAKFYKEVLKLLQGYETAAGTKVDKMESHVYIKKAQEDILSELVVVTKEEDIAIIVMIGEIPVATLEESIKEHRQTDDEVPSA